MITVDDGRQFILYGGYWSRESREDRIWHYTIADNSWEVIGVMMEPREEHFVLPVENLECPN